MNRIVIILFAGLLFCQLHPREYVYPIGACDHSSNSSFIYVVHQKSIHDLGLFAWDPTTNRAYPLLHSLFMPAGVSFLPDNTGFSFIDKGRIRIKKFNKRSPKTIALRDLVYDPTPIVWIDEYNGCFSAKERNNYGIFHISHEGDIDPIVFNYLYDCMYPQKIADHLFYIQRSAQHSVQAGDNDMMYRIIQTSYPPLYYGGTRSFNNTNNFDERVDILLKNMKIEPIQQRDASVVADFGNRPMLALTMIDEHTGFILEHDISRGDDTHVRYFICHAILYSNGVWSTQPLFSFSLPTHLITDSTDRLYESIMPLLPRYYDGNIYFSDCLEDPNRLGCFYYNLFSSTRSLVAPLELIDPQALLFSPVYFKGKFFYGGPLDTAGRLISMREDDYSFYVDLPSIAG